MKNKVKLKTMKNGKLLSKTEMKNVKGGDYNNCYNVCMAGWNNGGHTKKQNALKVTGCDEACSG